MPGARWARHGLLGGAQPVTRRRRHAGPERDARPERDKGTGPNCTTAASGAEGSLTVLQNNGTIDFQVVDAVIYPPEEMTLYLDVGPADDFTDDTYRLIQCLKGKVVSNFTAKATNLWENIIFRGYPNGLRFKGVTMQGNGPASGTSPGIWNWRANPQDWEGTGDFIVAEWDIPQDCGGYCDKSKSDLVIQILARPLPDP